MSKASTPPGLFQRLLTRPTPMLQDPADYGTCFGLDLSLDQASAGPAPTAPADRPAPGWMQRLSRRARGAA